MHTLAGVIAVALGILLILFAVGGLLRLKIRRFLVGGAVGAALALLGFRVL